MASTIVVGTLRAILTTDTAQFDAGIRKAADQMKVFARDFARAGQQASQIGRSMTAAITLPILGATAAVGKFAMDFESSFAGVKKTVNATETEFAQMSQAFRDLSKQIPVNVNELNRLGEAAGAMGIPKAAIVDFTRVMALLGVTTNVTSEQAAESIGKIQNIFAAAGKDTDRFAATLVALGNDGASTESQILEMATRIAGAGNTVGMTQGQVLGFASALSSVGLEAEQGGSAISKVFTDIAVAVSKGGTDLANFARVAGMSTKDFSKQFKTDAAGAVTEFIEGLGRIKTSGGDLVGTLIALGFQESRQRDTLQRAAGAGDLLRRALILQSQAWRDNTALTIEAGKRFETTESQVLLLWNRLKDMGITIGNALLPMIKTLVATMNELLPVVEGMAQAFAELPGPIQVTILGFALFVAAIGPAIFVVGQFMTALSAIVGMSTLWSARLLTMGAAVATFGGVLAVFAGSYAFGTWLERNTKLGREFSDAFQYAALRLQGYTATQADAMIATSHATESALAQAKAAEKNVSATADFNKALAGTGPAAKKSATPLIELTNAQKAYAKALAEVNAKIALAQRDVGHLTQAQQDQVDSLDALGLSANDIAIKLRVSELAVKAYTDAELAAAKADGVRQKALQDLTGDIEKHMVAVGKQFDQEEERRAFAKMAEQLKMAPTLDDLITPNVMLVNGADTRIGKWGDVGKKMGQSIRDNMKAVVDTIPDLFVRAFTGGGGFLGALKALGVQMADAIVKPMIASMIKQLAAARLGQAVAGALGATAAGGAATAAAGTIAGAGGGAAAGGGLGGSLAAFATNPWTIGIAAGIGGALLLKHFLGGDEETKVNPLRDQFLAQFGGSGTGPGSGFRTLADRLHSGGRDSLFAALSHAATIDSFRNSENAIAAFLGARRFAAGVEVPRMTVKSFMSGGFVPPGATVPAMLHGGLYGEDITPRSSGGGGNSSITVNIHASALDPTGMDQVFKDKIIPRLKSALVLNTSGLLSVTQRTVR